MTTSFLATPRLAGFSMPPEWARHARTWMEFPRANETFGADPDGALGHFRNVWAAVANKIAHYEPVSMVCNLGDGDVARPLLNPEITIHETATGDAWARDSGPTFLTHPDGRLGATHWKFNAWGDQGFSDFTDERHVGAFMAGLAGAELFSSQMVNEGGGIHVDGDGSVMITETVQLDPDRNPNWNAEQVETELKSYLGVDNVIWLPRGLAGDYGRFGTRGHIDILASFVSPRVVLAHTQPDPTHPDFEICRENLRILRASSDAAGRSLRLVEMPAPATQEVDGKLVDWGYLNYYVCNGAVIMSTFDDPNDGIAAELMAELHPGREIVQHDARAIFECGGGVHCITQQQPAV